MVNILLVNIDYNDIGFKIRCIPVVKIFIFQPKRYVVDTQKKRLNEHIKPM